MADTAVLACSCKHPAQDSMYGLGKRLHNKTSKGWRCTICKSASNIEGSSKAKGGAAAKTPKKGRPTTPGPEAAKRYSRGI